MANFALLNVKMLRQNDNMLAPNQTCNTTCMAMCAIYCGIAGDNSFKQIEDQFTASMERRGLSRYDMDAMTVFMKGYAPAIMGAEFKRTYSVARLMAAIDRGTPVIVGGRFTPTGHFVVIRGYAVDDSGKIKFIVNDPNGEWWQTGYDRSMTNGVEMYSSELISRVCNDDGYTSTIWGIAVLPLPARKPITADRAITEKDLQR